MAQQRHSDATGAIELVVTDGLIEWLSLRNSWRTSIEPDRLAEAVVEVVRELRPASARFRQRRFVTPAHRPDTQAARRARITARRALHEQIRRLASQAPQTGAAVEVRHSRNRKVSAGVGDVLVWLQVCAQWAETAVTAELSQALSEVLAAWPSHLVRTQ